MFYKLFNKIEYFRHPTHNLTDAIQDWILDVATGANSSGERPDVCLVELGGTVGDIESAVYLEALQQPELE